MRCSRRPTPSGFVSVVGVLRGLVKRGVVDVTVIDSREELEEEVALSLLLGVG